MTNLKNRVLNENGNFDVPANCTMEEDKREIKILQQKIIGLETALKDKRSEITSLKQAINGGGEYEKGRILDLEKENRILSNEIEVMQKQLQNMGEVSKDLLKQREENDRLVGENENLELKLSDALEKLQVLSEANVKLAEENAKQPEDVKKVSKKG